MRLYHLNFLVISLLIILFKHRIIRFIKFSCRVIRNIRYRDNIRLRSTAAKDKHKYQKKKDTLLSFSHRLLLYSSTTNKEVDKYLSPVSGSKTTIFFPAFSLRFANCVAA